MKVDCLLINPGSRSDQYQALGDEFSAIEPPSLAALFASYLRLHALSVEIIDALPYNLGPVEVAEIATETYQPVLIVMVVYGFQPSASTQNMTAAGRTCRAIKELNPNAKILMTGTHPAALPERTMREEAIDYVCDGEGPTTIRRLITAINDKWATLHPINNLWYRDNGHIQSNKGGSLIKDLSASMPVAAWDLLPMQKYRAHNWHAFESIDKRQPYASIHTSLGCPYKCTFCCINAPFGGSSYRMWDPVNVVDQLEQLVNQYGVRHIKFVDEMFVLNRNHVIGICDEIDRRRLGDSLNIWAYARVDTVKGEYLSRLRRSGFRWLALGIESASRHVRDGVEKGRFGSREILSTVSDIQSAGIHVIGNYIFGLPDDTHESMQATLDLALEANCEFANFYSAMAYPGSKLYSLAMIKGWKLPDTWIGYSQHAYETEPLPTDTLTGAEVLRFRDQAFHRYYSDDSYISMISRKFGMPAVENIIRMRQQPLPRKLLG